MQLIADGCIFKAAINSFERGIEPVIISKYTKKSFWQFGRLTIFDTGIFGIVQQV
ncbi:MAG: hypothetical protein ACYT04_42585 [Nostoc sp.]